MQDAEAIELENLAQSLVERARRAGMQVAEVTARQGYDLSVRVRLGQPELVEEAGHRGVTLRVMRDQRVALSSTSDLTPEGLDRLVSDAVELVDLCEADPFAGPADPEDLCHAPHPDLDLYDATVAEIRGAQALQIATEAERVALASDPRLTLSEGATFSRSTGLSAMVLSGGFSGVQRGSYASLSVAPVVEDEGGKKRRGYYWTASRHASGLETAEAVGKEAARRTLRKLGARKVPTGEAAVVFDPDVARSLLGSFAGCILGGSIWRKSSYLVEREGTPVASPLVTIVDDPLIPGAPGSRAYDGEGLRSVRQVVVERGVLKTFLLDSYSGRKLKRKSTASAARSGGVGPSTSNLLLQAGPLSPAQLIKETGTGLYVTEMMGFGFNALTGDFSRGAAGFWIENGELAFPVSEVTISSNLDTMLKGIDALADDLVLRTSTAAPTLRVQRMTISGT
ncbi:MAG TPA: metallopeptidase TldD-related protein [Polyangiaceae bacterium]|nr:metallopeptidase TldD-related protein [Polyangiaceae bacterium]